MGAGGNNDLGGQGCQKKLEDSTTKLQEDSLWDASLFLFVQGLDFFSSGFGLLVLVLNGLVQLAFAVLLFFSISSSSITDATTKSFMNWRLRSAHQFRYFNPLT